VTPLISWLDRIAGKSPGQKPDWLAEQQAASKKYNPQQFIGDTWFVAFDTELTGLDFRKDSIISIGAVRLRGTGILPGKTFYHLVKPESELKRESVVVHEITHSDLEKADELADAMQAFVEFIGNAVLIGHFVHIDLNFVNRALKKLYGCSLQNRSIDTSTLHDWLYENDSNFARHHRGMTTKTDLFSLAKKYGIANEKSHNAFYDAYLTAQLFQRFAHFLPQAGVRTIKDLLQIARP